MANLEPLATSWDDQIHKKSPICIDPLSEVMSDYMETIQQHCHHREKNQSSQLNITYTAMHGVGERFAIEAFKAFSLRPFFTTIDQVGNNIKHIMNLFSTYLSPHKFVNMP